MNGGEIEISPRRKSRVAEEQWARGSLGESLARNHGGFAAASGVGSALKRLARGR